jgi:hypothetical protein
VASSWVVMMFLQYVDFDKVGNYGKSFFLFPLSILFFPTMRSFELFELILICFL